MPLLVSVENWFFQMHFRSDTLHAAYLRPCLQGNWLESFVYCWRTGAWPPRPFQYDKVVLKFSSYFLISLILTSLSIHSGKTIGDIPLDFGTLEREQYKKIFVPMYGRFLKKCYCKLIFLPRICISDLHLRSSWRMSCPSSSSQCWSVFGRSRCWSGGSKFALGG